MPQSSDYVATIKSRRSATLQPQVDGRLTGITVRSGDHVPHAVLRRTRRLHREALQLVLRQLRLGAGLRQGDLARLLGEPQSFVSKYESGERRLDLLELRQICQGVGISLTDFVNRLEKSLR